VYLRCNRPRQAKSVIVWGGGGGANDYRESELELVIECEQTYLVAVVLLLFMAADWLRRISVEYRKRPLCSEN
jgi:hypothetical protein